MERRGRCPRAVINRRDAPIPWVDSGYPQASVSTKKLIPPHMVLEYEQ